MEFAGPCSVKTGKGNENRAKEHFNSRFDANIANQRCESKINTPQRRQHKGVFSVRTKTRNRANSTPSEIMRFLFDLHLPEREAKPSPSLSTLSLIPASSGARREAGLDAFGRARCVDGII